MKKIIILSILLIVGVVFSDNNTEITSVNNNEFVTIYYDDGSFSTHDSTQNACSITFGFQGKKNDNPGIDFDYEDGIFSIPDSTQSVEFNKNFEKKALLVECYMFADGNENNIIKAEHIDRIVKRDGEIITGKKIRKTFNMISIIGTSTLYLLAGGIIISLVLLAYLTPYDSQANYIITYCWV